MLCSDNNNSWTPSYGPPIFPLDFFSYEKWKTSLTTSFPGPFVAYKILDFTRHLATLHSHIRKEKNILGMKLPAYCIVIVYYFFRYNECNLDSVLVSLIFLSFFQFMLGEDLSSSQVRYGYVLKASRKPWQRVGPTCWSKTSQHVGAVCYPCNNIQKNPHSFEAMTQQEEAAACLIISLIHDEDANKNRRKTQNWIKKREQYGLYVNLVQELRTEDTNA